MNNSLHQTLSFQGEPGADDPSDHVPERGHLNQALNGGRTMKFTFQPESRPLEGYTIKRAIHRGGFGEVYYALSDAGKEVALKLLRQHLDVELRGISQCLNLKHPNLVTIFDVRTDTDGDHWVVMEYISGRSLNQVLREHPQGLPIEDVRTWIKGMCEGLSFLHDRGIVHRDLKPANVFLEHGVVKIGDVGLSKFISESHRSAQTQSVGTVYYMAPEVAHGRYGREVDIYSLGIVLYELLTGRVPFEGESAGEILMKHLSEKPDLGPVPPRLRPVLARALEKDPLRRTPSAAELLEDFNKAILGIEIAGTIPNPSDPGPTVADHSTRERENGGGFDGRLQREVAREVRNAAEYAKKAARHARHVAKEARKQARRERRERRHTQRSSDRRADEARSHEHDVHRVSRQNGAQSHGHHGSSGKFGFALRVLAVIVILILLFSPAMLGSFLRSAIVVGIYGGLGYGLYRLLLFFSGNSGGDRATEPVQRGNRREVDRPPFDQAGPQTFAAAHVAADPPPVMKCAARKKSKKRRSYVMTPNTPRTMSMRQRTTELLSSLTFAVLCTAVITAGVHYLTPFFGDPANIGLFAGTTLFGSWSILTVSKLWEGRGVDSSMRRLVLLLLGAAVGFVAYSLDGVLMASLPFSYLTHPEGLLERVGPHPLFDGRFQPTLAGYVLFFAGLFSLRRWWWHADSFRRRRFRLASVLLTVALAFGLTLVFSFPQVWAMTWAAAIASIVHLSATWVPPQQRAGLVEAQAEA